MKRNEGKNHQFLNGIALAIVIIINWFQVSNFCNLVQAEQINFGRVVAINGGEKNRITLGRDAWPGEVPFQVELLKWNATMSKFKFACGGAIIDNETILTAAHCVTAVPSRDKIPGKYFKLSVGEYDRSIEDGEQEFDVSQIMVHKGYRLSSYDNDIAILKTTKQISFGLTEEGFGSVGQVCLPKQIDIDYQAREPVYVSGWGADKSIFVGSKVLKVVDRPIIDREECRREYLKIKSPVKINVGHVCVSNHGGKGWWKGDSGGPIFRPSSGTSRQAQLVGLISFGNPDPLNATDPEPRVGTRISHYLQWILHNCSGCCLN